MKNPIFILACLSMLAYSCTEKKEDTSVVVEDQVPTLPMELTYPGKPTIGSWDNVTTVMEWNKRVSQLNMDFGDLLDDSLKVMLADGTEFDLPRDSAVNFIKGFAANIASIKLVYVAAIPINNVDKNDQWVTSWTDETFTMKDGKVDHNLIHEDYLMRNGKIREIIQYARKDPADVKK